MANKRKDLTDTKANTSGFDMMASTFKNLPKEIRRLETQADWANTFSLFLPLLNSAPNLAIMFLSDPYALCEDLEIDVSKELRTNLDNSEPIMKYIDPELYSKLKQGSRIPGLREVKFVPNRFLKKQVSLEEIKKKIQFDNPTFNSKQSPLRLPVKKKSGSTFSGTNSSLFFNSPFAPVPVMRGWTVVMQITEDYISDLFEKILETQFNIALIIAVFSGDNDFANLAEPWHSYSAWLGFTFAVDFTIEFVESDEPGLTIEAVDSDEVAARLKIKGHIMIEDQVANFEGVATQKGRIIRDEDQRSYYVDFTRESPEVSIEGNNDEILEILAAFAVYDYFNKEVPTLQLFTLPDDPPFLFFEQSGLNSVDSIGPFNALTWTFGDSTQRVDPYDRFIVRPGHNLTIGQSTAAMQFIIRRDLPELPLVSEQDPNITIKSIDIELRGGPWSVGNINGIGYVEVTGNGRYRTGDCYPDVDFSYSIHVGLRIDNNGDLQEVIISSGINLPAWMYIVHGLILAAIGLAAGGPIGGVVGGTVGLVGTAVAEGILGSEVANNIGNSFEIETNIEQQLNDSFAALNESTAGFITLGAEVREVEINPNGVFFHGNLTTEAVLGFD